MCGRFDVGLASERSPFRSGEDCWLVASHHREIPPIGAKRPREVAVLTATNRKEDDDCRRVDRSRGRFSGGKRRDRRRPSQRSAGQFRRSGLWGSELPRQSFAEGTRTRPTPQRVGSLGRRPRSPLLTYRHGADDGPSDQPHSGLAYEREPLLAAGERGRDGPRQPFKDGWCRTSELTGRGAPLTA